MSQEVTLEFSLSKEEAKKITRALKRASNKGIGFSKTEYSAISYAASLMEEIADKLE